MEGWLLRSGSVKKFEFLRPFIKATEKTEKKIFCFGLAFPTGRDSATFRDKGTEISSLSRDKGTTGQAQNLATGRDGTGF